MENSFTFVYFTGHSSKYNGLKLLYKEFTKLRGLDFKEAVVVFDTCYAENLMSGFDSLQIAVSRRDEESLGASLNEEGFWEYSEFVYAVIRFGFNLERIPEEMHSHLVVHKDETMFSSLNNV